MATTRETLRLLGQIRIQIADTVDGIIDDLVRSWAYSWNLVLRDWQDAVADLQAASGDKRWPTRSQVLRAERAQRALEATYAGLQRLTEHAGITITAGVSQVTNAAAGHLDVIASQVPDTHQAIFRTSLVRADTEQINQIILRTQEQVTKLVAPVAGDAFETIRETLIRGVAQGQNPRVAARRMVRGIEVGYNEALTRAMVITRTEMLDAHRAAARLTGLANANVLQGWQWVCALDARTCPSCWAQHGTIHPLDEFGPIDHQQGRCSGLPVTRSWKDLGFDIEEPASVLQDAEAKFQTLSPSTQRKIMGPQRLQLLNNGDISWSDLSTLRHNPGWRDSQVVTPLRDLVSA
jgi:SPP1 gp7 family putative phage head morphogenesis protein